jgi:hypothetical protein
VRIVEHFNVGHGTVSSANRTRDRFVGKQDTNPQLFRERFDRNRSPNRVARQPIGQPGHLAVRNLYSGYDGLMTYSPRFILNFHAEGIESWQTEEAQYIPRVGDRMYPY